jgi:hypothetical protein
VKRSLQLPLKSQVVDAVDADAAAAAGDLVPMYLEKIL